MTDRTTKFELAGLTVLCLILSATPDTGERTGATTVTDLFRQPRVQATRALYPVSDSWSIYNVRRPEKEQNENQSQQNSGTPDAQEERKNDTPYPSAPDGYELWRSVDAKLTAYEPTSKSCGIYANGKTSIGQNAWNMDGVAVDPRVIPYGTKIWIPGVGFREADDTGSAMRQSWSHQRQVHIDIRMPYYYQAREWGVQHRTVYLFRPAR